MTTVFATGADERYGVLLLNLLGSVRRNSDIFDRVVAYDLGLSLKQRGLLEAIDGVEVAEVPAFAPHWKQGFSWKPWIWTHLEADSIFWLDAGATVLRELSEPLRQVAERGYFVVGQGHPVRPMIPSGYYALYGIGDEVADREAVAAGIVGFAPGGDFYRDVVVPTYEDVLAGRSLGFSAEEVERLNYGLNATVDPVIHDCPTFRWDQTLFNIRLYSALPAPVVNDLYQFGGWESPHVHPEQVIWGHRRRSDFRYLWRIPWRRGRRLAGLAFTARYQFNSWRVHNGWRLRPATYWAKARTLVKR